MDWRIIVGIIWLILIAALILFMWCCNKQNRAADDADRLQEARDGARDRSDDNRIAMERDKGRKR